MARNVWVGTFPRALASVLALVSYGGAGCSSSDSDDGSPKSDASLDVAGGSGGSSGTAGSGGAGASGGSSGVGGAANGGSAGAAGGGGGSGGSSGSGGSGAGTGGGGSGGVPANCEVLLDVPGLAHESTAALLKKSTPIADNAPTSWQRVDVSLDVFVADWNGKQGQHEVFTLLRANATDHKFRWVSGAIGYVALIGPASQQTVVVANLNLPGAAAPDGRRITKSYKYQAQTSYHLDYTYDVPNDLRQVKVSENGQQVTVVTGKVSVPQGTPPVTSIEVPTPGFELLLGGEEVAGAPDASTLGWKFSNLKVVGCH